MQISVSCDDGYKAEMHIVPEVTAKQLFEELCNLRRITGHDGEHAEYPQRPTVAFQPPHSTVNAPQFIAAGVPLSSVLNGKTPTEGLPQFHVFGFKGLKQFAAIHEIQNYSAKITEMSQRLSSAIGLYAQHDHVEAQRVIAPTTSPVPLPALVSSRPSSSSSSSSSSVAVSSSSLSTSTSSSSSLPTIDEVTAGPANLAVEAATNLAKTFVLTMHALLEKYLNGEEVLTMTARKKLTDAKDALKSTNMVSLLKSLKLPRANIIIDEAAKGAAGVTTKDAPAQPNLTAAQTTKAPAEKAPTNNKAPPTSGKTSTAANTVAPAAAAKSTTTPTVSAGPSEEVKLTRGQKAAATRAANKIAKQKTESEAASVAPAVTAPAVPAPVPVDVAPKPAPVPAAAPAVPAPAPVPVPFAQLETQPMDVEESESSSEDSSSEGSDSGSESDSSENSFANRMHSNTQTPHVNKTRTSVVTQSPIQKKEEVTKSSSGESESSSSEDSSEDSSSESESESESESDESGDEEEPKTEQSMPAMTATTTTASETSAVADAAAPVADVIEIDQSSGESSSESDSDSDSDSSGDESDSESEDSESDGESDSELVKTVVTQAPLPSALAEPLDVYAVNDSQATVFELPVKEKSPFSSGSESDTESSSDSSDDSDSSSDSEGEKEPLQLRKTSEHVKTPAPKKQISAKASSALKALSGGMLFTKSPSHILPVHNRQRVVLTESQPALSDQESSGSGSSSSDDSSDSEPESQESIVLTSTEPRVVPVSTPAPKSRNADTKKSKTKAAPGELRNLIAGTAPATSKNGVDIIEIDANSSNTGKRSRTTATAGSNAKRSKK